MWLLVVFFFFKQKTAYELRISDWSSDVCSSDLLQLQLERLHVAARSCVRQQRAALVDDRHLFGVHAGHRRGDEKTDRLHLAVRKRAAVLERQHHRRGGGLVDRKSVV